ncbi:DUF2793 domain-containing protein [Ochrobactrum sp. GPK 3]
MAERTLPGLGLMGYWTPGADGWNTGMDANLRVLSVVTQMGVLSKVTNLPATPTNGQIFIVPSGGDANKIAVRDADAWVMLVPKAGWRAWIADTASYAYFDGSMWVDEVDDAGLPDAPNDGKLYGRKNQNWAEVVTSGGGDGGESGAGARFKYDWGGLSIVKAWQFEDGLMPNDFAWTSPVGAGTISSRADDVAGLSRSMRFPAITSNQSAYFDVSVDVPIGGANLVVRTLVSSENGYDLFRVFVDDVEALKRSGVTDTAFVESTIPLDAGGRVIRFQYSKDSSGNAGDDTTWISRIRIDALTTEKTYIAGDTVKHADAYWLCLVDDTAQEPSPTTNAWVQIGGSGGSGGANTAAISAFIPGTYANGQILLTYPVIFSGALLSGAIGSIAKGAAPQAAASLAILKNGSSVGTINFAAGVAEGTFTVASNVAFMAGDILTIQAPTTADPALANLSISLKLSM